MNSCDIRLIASDRSWVEGEAVRQLQQTAALPGMVVAVGLPDLHPGRGTPIGAVFASRDVFYPHLVGNDIGCGMALWQTELVRRKVKRDRWVERLQGLESEWTGDRATAQRQLHFPIDDNYTSRSVDVTSFTSS